MSLSTTAKFKAVIDLPYGELNSLLEWCKRNCLGVWQFKEGLDEDFDIKYINNNFVFSTNGIERMRILSTGNVTFNSNFYTIYFEDERDYIAFTIFKK